MMEMDSFSGFSPYHSECMMLSVVVISFDIGQVFMLRCLDNENSHSHGTFSYKLGFNIQFYMKSGNFVNPFFYTIICLKTQWSVRCDTIYKLLTENIFWVQNISPKANCRLIEVFTWFMDYGIAMEMYIITPKAYCSSVVFLISLFLYYDSLLLLCQSRRLIDRCGNF